MKFFRIFFLLLFFIDTLPASGQEQPPQPIKVYVNQTQGLNFGAFFQGIVGGTVIVYANGSRSVTGDIIQASFGFSFSPALFEIESAPGTVISVLNGPDVPLSGSNGGSVMLHIGPPDTGSPFITSMIAPSRTQIHIGGTLTVGSPLANPSGAYSGNFSVTFIQE